MKRHWMRLVACSAAFLACGETLSPVSEREAALLTAAPSGDAQPDGWVVEPSAALSRPPADSHEYRLLRRDDPGVRDYGDTYDLAVFWECGSDCGYLPDTGEGPGPCLGLTYDGVPETCGTNVFSGAGVEILESETDNGDGTVTVIVQIGSSDGSDMMPNGTECAPGDLIDILGFHLGCDVACGLGAARTECPSGRGDDLNPGLPNPPYKLVEADAVILGPGGAELVSFPLPTSGTTQRQLGTQFTVGGVGGVTVTAVQFRFRIAVGTFATGACCLPSGGCIDQLTELECTAEADGTYQGDFTTCPQPCGGAPVNDDCDGASTVHDGVTPFATVGATLDADAPPPCSATMLDDVWFAYDPTCTGDLTIGISDTERRGAGAGFVMELYCGADCATMTSEYCLEGSAPSITVPATPANPYIIRVGGSDGADVTGNLSITCTTSMGGGGCCLDAFSCADASDEATCTGAGGTYLGDGHFCGAVFVVEALNDAAVIDTCSSSYNTELSVYDVCGGTLLAWNDDCADTLSGAGADPDASCYDPSTSSTERDSCVCVETTPGTSYLILVHGFGGNPPPPGSSTSLFVLHSPTCTLPASGACSLPDSTCVEGVTQSACKDNGGTYYGDDTSCTPDCNSNGVPDGPEIAEGSSQDCNTNGIPDECDIAAGAGNDVNSNGIPDECEQDCNSNGVPDAVDIAQGTSQDCNNNFIPDECDIAGGTSTDLNSNGLVDECEDCNTNGIPDSLDIAGGTSNDVNTNAFPDECEPDSNTNGIPDDWDIAMGTSQDANSNFIPDESDIAMCTSFDLNHNGVPDDAEIADAPDLNTNGVNDLDSNGNGILDEAEQPANHHSSIPMQDGLILDHEFAEAIREALINSNGTPNVKDAKFFFAECYGGGMLDDLARELDDHIPWVGGSAARHDEFAWAEDDKPADPTKPLGLWSKQLHRVLGDRTVLRALKRAALKDPHNPMHAPSPAKTERPQYRFSTDGRGITLEDEAAASHHAVMIAGKPDKQRHTNNLRTFCDVLADLWGNLNTNGTSVHILFGDGTSNPCSSNGVPDANVKAATLDNFLGVLTALNSNGLLGPDEEFVVYVTDHGGHGVVAAPAAGGGGGRTGDDAGARGGSIELVFDLPAAVQFGMIRNPFNQPEVRVIVTGAYAPNEIEVLVNGQSVGFLDPSALNEEGQNETVLWVYESLVQAGANSLVLQSTGGPLEITLIEASFYSGDINELPTFGWGDADGDGDVDPSDLLEFTNCLSGAGGGYLLPECINLDIDGDGDVDLDDYRLFQAVYTGQL